MSEKLPMNVRDGRDGDIPFVMSTWLEHYASSSPWTKHIPRETFFAGHRPLIEALLKKPGVRLLIAVDKQDDDTIYGWLAHETRYDGRTLMHFSYVKKPFRRAGVLRRLLDVAEMDLTSTTLTHWTYSASEMNRSHTLSYNPYLLWENI